MNFVHTSKKKRTKWRIFNEVFIYDLCSQIGISIDITEFEERQLPTMAQN